MLYSMMRQPACGSEVSRSKYFQYLLRGLIVRRGHAGSSARYIL